MATEQDARLARIEADIHEAKADICEIKADITDIKVNVAKITATLEATFPHLATKESVAKMETTLESTLPHVATKAEVEEAKHEATKGKYGLLVGVIALLLSLGTLAARFIGK